MLREWRDAARSLGDALDLAPGVASLALGLLLFLAGAIVLRGLAHRRQRDAASRRRWRSVATWGILVSLFVALLVLGPSAVALALCVLSLFLLREGLSLASSERLLPAGAVATLATYAWAWLDWTSLFTRALPLVAALLLLAVVAERRSAGSGPERGGKRFPLSMTVTAFLLTVVGPSYCVAVASLPSPSGRPGPGMEWFALLIVLTELNDSAQAWWGRSLGKRPLAPRLSPAKTWAGLWGGLGTTALAALLLAPVLTPYAGLRAAAIGFLVGLAGTAGDLVESGLKRNAGRKDSGSVLPGHGGLMDRFDSLALTAPVYFVVSWILWFPAGSP